MSLQKTIVMFSSYVPDGAITRLTEILHNRWIGQGAFVDEFERNLQGQLKVPHMVAVNVATAALRLALSITGVKPDDEVITTPMTCTVTNHAILEQFAKPVFADIQHDSGNIDPGDIERRITSRTKAIMCTHWGGTPCDLREIQAIAQSHGLTVIEDASEAFGATYNGRSIGALSRFTAFSFHAVQIVTAGEGGALSARDCADAESARIQRWYGIDRKRRHPNQMGYYDFDIDAVGFGYHMTNISAAIGLESLKHYNILSNRRAAITNQYRKSLTDVPGLRLFKAFTDRESSNHFFTIHVERREDFFRKLKEHNIETSIVHYRNDAYTVFGGLRSDLPNLDRFIKTYIALPTHAGLTSQDVDYIISTIRSGW